MLSFFSIWSNSRNDNYIRWAVNIRKQSVGRMANHDYDTIKIRRLTLSLTVRKCVITVYYEWKICEKWILIKSDVTSWEKTINVVDNTHTGTDVLSFQNSIAECDHGYLTSMGKVRERHSQVTGHRPGMRSLTLTEKINEKARQRSDTTECYGTIWYKARSVETIDIIIYYYVYGWNHYFDIGITEQIKSERTLNKNLAAIFHYRFSHQLIINSIDT